MTVRAMFCLKSFLPLRAGSFCSSRFLLRLNRDELCRRSFFTIWGPPEYLILLSWVGGGVLLLGRLLAVCWAWGKKKKTQMFWIKMGTFCHSTTFGHRRCDLLMANTIDKTKYCSKEEKGNPASQRQGKILILESILLEKYLDIPINARWVINIFGLLSRKRRTMNFKCVYLLKANGQL